MGRLKTKTPVDSFTNRYLELVLQHLKITSDYALADKLGVSPQAIFKMRAGGGVSITTAVRIGKILDIEPSKILAEIELERETDPERKSFWEEIGRKVAIVIVGAFAGFAAVPPPTAHASAGFNNNLIAACQEYTLRNKRRWLQAALLGALAFSASTHAHADELDAALLGGALATLAADWGQTRAIAQQPDRFHEINPILGRHPSIGRVNSYFALAMLGTAGLAFALPREYSRIFLGGVVLLEAAVIVNNHGIGIRARF